MAISTKPGRRTARQASRSRRHLRVRKKVEGTQARPRLIVNRSSRHVFVQIIDDTAGRTIASASSLEGDIRDGAGDKTAKARQVGSLVAERAKAAGIESSSSTAAATVTPDVSQRWPMAHAKPD